MQGSLALHKGIVFVGRQAKTATVEAFDLDGRRVGESFSFRDERLGRSVVGALAVDDERRVWVADTPASRVRIFTVFGREVGGLGLGLDADPLAHGAEDVRGRVRRPAALAVRGDADGLLLYVGSGGERQHGVQVFDETGALRADLPSLGGLRTRFRDVSGLAERDGWLWVAERAAGRVQVFRRGDFHFAFDLPAGTGGRAAPSAVAPLGDGRVLVSWGGEASGLGLFDAAGRFRRLVAGHGTEEGAVFEPNDVLVEPGESERRTRVVVIDRDGDRVQVFNLEGRCYGAFGEPGP